MATKNTLKIQRIQGQSGMRWLICPDMVGDLFRSNMPSSHRETGRIVIDSYGKQYLVHEDGSLRLLQTKRSK